MYNLHPPSRLMQFAKPSGICWKKGAGMSNPFCWFLSWQGIFRADGVASSLDHCGGICSVMNEAEEQAENSALQHPTESAQMVMWGVCSLQGCKAHHLNAE